MSPRHPSNAICQRPTRLLLSLPVRCILGSLAPVASRLSRQVGSGPVTVLWVGGAAHVVGLVCGMWGQRLRHVESVQASSAVHPMGTLPLPFHRCTTQVYAHASERGRQRRRVNSSYRREQKGNKNVKAVIFVPPHDCLASHSPRASPRIAPCPSAIRWNGATCHCDPQCRPLPPLAISPPHAPPFPLATP